MWPSDSCRHRTLSQLPKMTRRWHAPNPAVTCPDPGHNPLWTTYRFSTWPWYFTAAFSGECSTAMKQQEVIGNCSFNGQTPSTSMSRCPKTFQNLPSTAPFMLSWMALRCLQNFLHGKHRHSTSSGGTAFGGLAAVQEVIQLIRAIPSQATVWRELHMLVNTTQWRDQGTKGTLLPAMSHSVSQNLPTGPPSNTQMTQICSLPCSASGFATVKSWKVVSGGVPYSPQLVEEWYMKENCTRTWNPKNGSKRR